MHDQVQVPDARVLIAEDDPVARGILRGILTKMEFEPVPALDGTQAWDILQGSDPPLLILMDWMMPGVDGIELCRRVRERTWAIEPYIVMVTGRTESEDIVEGLDAGANDYVRKPIDPAELRARVDVGVKYLELRRELARQLAELRRALEHVQTLQGILPICSYCKQIRDDQQAWHQMEAYVSRHTDAQFSHGICPSCMAEHFPES